MPVSAEPSAAQTQRAALDAAIERDRVEFDKTIKKLEDDRAVEIAKAQADFKESENAVLRTMRNLRRISISAAAKEGCP
jgi:hypothetical protein